MLMIMDLYMVSKAKFKGCGFNELEFKNWRYHLFFIFY